MVVVSKTWYRELKMPRTFYTAVTALHFFTHLISNRGGLHDTDAVKILAPMMELYNKAKEIPQYINMLEEAQAQAERATLPISNDALVNISNRVMLASNDFPEKTKLRNKLAPTSRKWDLWKPTYQEVYISNRF